MSKRKEDKIINIDKSDKKKKSERIKEDKIFTKRNQNNNSSEGMTSLIDLVESQSVECEDNDSFNENYNSGRWKPEENERFIQALLKYGNEWKSVQKHVVTRSSSQTRSHAQKFFVKIKKTNLLDFNIDLNKNSIKSLHDVANQMNGDQYLNTIKTLNNLAFEKK
jgi:SHAQKYF class myb-like DNA-binding protein